MSDVAGRRTRRSTSKKRREAPPDAVRGAPLEPIRVVERELTRPDGTTLIVEVPVYPPFRLRDPAEAKAAARAKKKAS
jgi:hypothetical protein